jgi:diguanylate cyclase (GGDEF)-like protein/putative nucleotidyltransferase with HDIG domain
MSLASLARPDAPGEDPIGVLLVGLSGAIVGLIVWYLPWHAWPRRAGLLLVPMGFALIALRNAVGGDDPHLYGVFFVVVFMWIGIAYPRWTGLKMLPLFAAAYLLPLMYGGGWDASAASSAAYVGLACVLVAESLAWVWTKLRRSQMALWRARDAMDHIAAELASKTDPDELWPSICLRLSRLLDVPDCDVYRLERDGSLVCLASIADSEPCPGYIGIRRLWATDREAIKSREPVVIASPADPRLSESERAEMLSWNEEAFALVPLLARDEVIGMVEIGETRKGRTITPEQVATAVPVCRLIAMLVNDLEVIRTQEEQARVLASLLESSRAVASGQSMEDALTIVTRNAAEVLGASACIAYEHDRDLDAIVARAMWEKTPTGWDGLGEPLPLDGDPMGRAILESGRPLLERLSDPQLNPVSRAQMEQWGEKSCLTIPMLSADGPMGLLTFRDNERERDHSEDEIALATALGELAGEAVRSAKLLRRLRRLSETDSLTGLANHRMIHKFLDKEQARAERYGTHFSLAMLDIDGFKLLNDTYGHPTGDVVLRQVASLLREQTRASDIVGRYGGDEYLLILPQTASAEAGALAEKLRSALVETACVTPSGERIPIQASFGIAAYPQDGRNASELVAAADANLYVSKRRGGDAVTGAEEKQTLTDDEAGSFSLFESLVTAVDNKDCYTRHHSEEVTEHALALADALGLSEASQRVLRVAALLHDVGKIGIPDRILRKPGRLTTAEYELVKGHAALGETIIAAIPDLDEIRAAVVSHHERYDGSGYPRGLASGEIPLFGRILAVADAYSAMTTDRPYHKALSSQEAITELRACSGTQFDPEIVDAFIARLHVPDEGSILKTASQ